MKHPIPERGHPWITGGPLLVLNNQKMLICPLCNDSIHTHMDSVEVTNAAGKRCIVNPTGEDDYADIDVESDEFPRDTYTGRRHTISVTLWCEQCWGTLKINFQQHKGNTFVSTEVGELTVEEIE